MGLDYSYRLYFQKQQIWDVLQGIVQFADMWESTTRILFPDRTLEIHLPAWATKGNSFHYDDVEISFTTSLLFEVDDAIQEYIEQNNMEENYLTKPDKPLRKLASIGCIYLYVIQDLADRHPQNIDPNLVLFDFTTTGTRMSILFEYSQTIRQSFTDLLHQFDGVCGVFNREMEGEVFWLNNHPIDPRICDPWSLPEQIKEEISW